MKFELIKVTYDLSHSYMDMFTQLYDWDRLEPQREYFTCRPIKELPDRYTYCTQFQERIRSGQLELYIFVSAIKKPIGRIVMFDFNSRNESAEFGYYLPAEHRGKRLGSRMVELFLDSAFDENSRLNKVYATTASNNVCSIRLLERLGFKLDGRLREHYWIDDLRYDQLHYSLLRSEWI